MGLLYLYLYLENKVQAEAGVSLQYKTTWHRIPQYYNLDTAVRISLVGHEQCRHLVLLIFFSFGDDEILKLKVRSEPLVW
jgi:hypothetical protein